MTTYHTVPEAAVILRVSRRTLDRRIADKTFKVDRIGTRIIISDEAIETFVASTRRSKS